MRCDHWSLPESGCAEAAYYIEISWSTAPEPEHDAFGLCAPCFADFTHELFSLSISQERSEAPHRTVVTTVRRLASDPTNM